MCFIHAKISHQIEQSRGLEFFPEKSAGKNNQLWPVHQCTIVHEKFSHIEMDVK